MEILDLSIETLMRVCKGNVKNLPSFIVHDNDKWPAFRRVQLDSKNRIHMRRTTFLGVVVPKVPVRAGLWIRPDAQEFHIDLQPHHLQGSAEMAAANTHKHSREIVKADDQGRTMEDQGYGESANIPQPARLTRADFDSAVSEAGGALRGVGSAVLSGGDTEA